MKFKAKISNLSLFTKIVSVIEKIGKTCVLHLTPKRIQFILTTDLHDGVQIWSGLNAESIFDDYQIESLTSNEISMEVNLDILQRVLKAGLQKKSHDIAIKLTKKNNDPYLSLVVVIQSTQLMTVKQDIPVKMLLANQMASKVEPNLPEPNVHILMPPLKILRNVIDRMKAITDYVHLSANMGGELTLRIQTEMVSIQTFFNHLEHPTVEGRSPPQHNPEQKASVKLDIKKFSRILFSDLIQPQNVICCIVETKAVIFHVLLDDLFMTFYIPVVLAN